jgi:hypothetical protein
MAGLVGNIAWAEANAGAAAGLLYSALQSRYSGAHSVGGRLRCGGRGSNPLSSTRKSAQIDVIS